MKKQKKGGFAQCASSGWIAVGQAEVKRMCARAIQGRSGVFMWGAPSERGHQAVSGENER